MKFTSSIIVALCSTMAAVGNAQTIVDIAQSTGVHETLVSLVGQAGLVETLSGDGPLTVFAPTDDAFAALPESAGKFTTEEWSAHLTDILTYHVHAGDVRAAALTADMPVPMVNGESATITTLDPPTIDNSVISGPDNVATNGVVHVVDSVLLPTSATATIVDIATAEAVADTFGTLVKAVLAGDLAGTLGSEGPFTVFAPTNEAFAKIDEATLTMLLSEEGKDQLVDILTYHVYPGLVYSTQLKSGEITMVNGDSATVDAKAGTIEGAKVIGDQILASNGVIHAIDTVIMPPADDATTAPETPVEDSSASMLSIGSAFAAILSTAAAFMVL